MPMATPEKIKTHKSARIRRRESCLRKQNTDDKRKRHPIRPLARAICADGKGSIRTKSPTLPKINMAEIYFIFAVFIGIL